MIALIVGGWVGLCVGALAVWVGLVEMCRRRPQPVDDEYDAALAIGERYLLKQVNRSGVRL